MDYKTEMKALEKLKEQDEAKKMAAQDKYYTGQTISGIISPLITGKEGRKGIEKAFTTPSTMEMQNIADRRKELLNKYKTVQGLQLGQNKEDRDFEKQKKLIGLKAQYDKAKEMRKPPKLTKGQEAIDVTFGKDVSLYNAAGGFSGIKSKINSLDKVIGKMDKGDVVTGPFTGMAQTFDTTSALFTPKTRAAGQNIARTVVETLRPILGAQFTEKEGQTIVQQTFDFSLPIEVNKERAIALKDVLLDQLKAKDEAIKYWNSAGGTLSGFVSSNYRKSADDIINEVKSKVPGSKNMTDEPGIAGAIDKGAGAVGEALLPSAEAAEGPQPGMVEDGYRFKGGDPSKQENWEKI